MDFLNKDITVKAIEPKKDQSGKDYVVVVSQGNERFSFFPPRENASAEQIESWEQVNELKWGNKLKAYYTESRKADRNGKPYLNMYGFQRLTEPEVAPAESKRQDTGRSKDEMIAYQVALKAAVELRKEDTAVIEADVLKTARIFLDFLMGNDERFPGEEG